MSECRIELGSHYFKVTKCSKAFERYVLSLAWEMTTYKLAKRGRKFVKVPAKTFASCTADKSEFRFHINQWKKFRDNAALSGLKISDKAIQVKPVPVPREAKLTLDGFVARDYQEPIIDYIVEPGPCKTITLQTGRGKTSTTLKSCEIIGEVLVVAVLGRYFDKWIGDLTGQYNLVEGDIITARGGKEFKNLLKYARTEEYKSCKVVLTTIDTIQGYIDEYRLNGLKNAPEWCCPPEDIYGRLGAGVRVIDEVHQHFHTVYTLDLYTNIKKAINLSATLKSDNPTINQMYLTAFPMESRMNGGKYIKVADCLAIHYNFRDHRPIRCTGFAKSYSHVIFEESLVKQKAAWEAYLNLIKTTIDKEYINICMEGQKCLIFAAKVETCELIRDYLEQLYPTKIVEKYTSEDDYDTFSRADIIVSTIGSSGTAIDIPGLCTVIMTTVINSMSANEQALGRLRDLRIAGFNPRFIYFCCDDIPKHKEYSTRKVELFSDMVFSHKHSYYERKL